MALVDRLADFREQYNISEYELSVGVEQEPDPASVQTLEKPDEMVQFLAEVNKVTNWIGKIKTAVEKISANNALLLVTYDHSAARQENTRLVCTITDVSRKVNVKLAELKRALDNSDKGNANYRAKLSQYHSLFSTISEVLCAYNEIQDDYKEKSRECIRKQLNYAGHAATEEELSRLVDSNTSQLNIPLLSISTFQKAQREVETRQTEIQLLEQNVLELRDMFYDIALLVDEQGETVDHISMHVELAHEYVFQGNVELVQATVYHDRSKKLKWCLCGVASSVIALFILAIVVIAIVIPQLESNRRPS
ncbi:hypothetical protein EMCRGX_G024146 [Ephydatia muelleri]